MAEEGKWLYWSLKNETNWRKKLILTSFKDSACSGRADTSLPVTTRVWCSKSSGGRLSHNDLCTLRAQQMEYWVRVDRLLVQQLWTDQTLTFYVYFVWINYLIIPGFCPVTQSFRLTRLRSQSLIIKKKPKQLTTDREAWSIQNDV